MTAAESPRLKLHMIWPRQRRKMPAQWPLPAGYSLRNYREGDREPYIQLMRSAGFETWDETRYQDVIATMHPQGLYFVVHDGSGALAATSAAQRKPREFYPDGGELGWVAAHPDHRGKGLGYVVCSAVTRRLLAEDHPFLYLLTDDFRLPAIRIYLNLGWIPFLHAPEVVESWRTVCAGLGVRYEDIEKTTDPAG